MVSKRKTKNIGIHTRIIRGLLHIFVPHGGNDFHPHLIRPVGLGVVALVAGVFYVVGSTAPTTGLVKGASDTGFSKETLLAESNKVRLANNLGSLELSDSLSAAAGLKARDMLVRQYWAHNAPDGTTPWYWFREVNYRYDFAGENLAKGFTTPSGVVTAWMNSEEHRKNALSVDYEDVGFGIAEGALNGEQTTVVVAMYGSPVGSPIATQEVLAASDGQLSLITRFGVGLQSLNPMVLGSIVVLGITTLVGLGAYAFRNRLPRGVRRDWKRHHALYQSLLTACLILVLITLYGDGQIL